MKRKKTPKQLAKDKAWKYFSLYIRVRDCIKTTGYVDSGICYTCGVRLPIKKLQAGHLVAGRTNSILFQEEAVRSQCLGCNFFKAGESGIFAIKLAGEIGIEKVKEFQKQKDDLVKYSEQDYLDIADKYKKKWEKLILKV